MFLFEFFKSEPVYYHSSDKKNLDILEPYESKLIDKKVVFAATLPEVAIAMSKHWTDDDFYFGRVNNQDKLMFDKYEFRELKKGNFKKFFDTSCYLYQVPAELFKSNKNIQDFEVISFKSVKPISVIKIDNILTYLKQSPYIKMETK